MSSTDMMVYLSYMSTWDTESDANIDALISEQSKFLSLGDFDPSTAIDSTFSDLDDLACQVRDLTIAADAIAILADAAAISTIWTFGLGAAAFVALEAESLVTRALISSKSSDLNKKLASIDTDISAAVGAGVQQYVAVYTQNNALIASKATIGLNVSQCRGVLLQFLSQVQRKGPLTAATFRTWAGSARQVYNSTEISDVYDALDALNLSGKTDADVLTFMKFLKGKTWPEGFTLAQSLVMNVSFGIMTYKLNIAQKTIADQAEAAGIEIAEVDATALGTMTSVGKLATALAVTAAVVDIIMQVWDIVDVVEQCDTMCTQLRGPVKDGYTSYYIGIRTASQLYQNAITPSPDGATAGGDVAQMRSQIDQWGSLTQSGVRIYGITGEADDPTQSSGLASKSDHGFDGFNGTWQVGDWGSSLTFTP
jgi:hypothetical protein